MTLDLEGFRSGSMNTLLPAEVLTAGADFAASSAPFEPSSCAVQPSRPCEIIVSANLSMNRRFLVTFLRRATLVLLLVCLGCSAQSVSPEVARRIEQQVRTYYTIPARVKVILGPTKPSEFPNYDALTITFDGGEKETDLRFPAGQGRQDAAPHDQARPQQGPLCRGHEKDRRQRTPDPRQQQGQSGGGQLRRLRMSLSVPACTRRCFPTC